MERTAASASSLPLLVELGVTIMTTIRVEGLDKLIRKLEGLGKLGYLRAGIKAATAHVKGKVNKYPPSSEANSPKGPGGGSWYQRGYGSRWIRRDGSQGGSKTSQTLGRRWTIRTENDGLTGIIGNNVTYSPFVHDKDKQTDFHAARGWMTTEKVAEQEAATVRKFIEAEIRKAIAGL
jgi:hypothetical protein